MSKRRYFKSINITYFKGLIFSITALLLVILCSTQIHANPPSNPKQPRTSVLSTYAKITAEKQVTLSSTKPSPPFKGTRWEQNSKLKLNVFQGGSAKVEFFDKKNKPGQNVTATAPDKSGRSEVGWPCNSKGGILGLDWKWDTNKKGCTVSGKTSLANRVKKSLKTDLSSLKSKSEVSQPQIVNNQPFFCSAANESTGKWDFAITESESFADIFSKQQACYEALTKCKGSGGKCDVTNFGAWEPNAEAVAVFDCSADESINDNNSTIFPNKISSKVISGKDIEKEVTTLSKDKRLKTLNYCVLRIFNEGQVTIEDPAIRHQKDGKFSQFGSPQKAIIAAVEGDADEVVSVVFQGKTYNFIDNKVVDETNINADSKKFLSFKALGDGKEKIVAFSTEGNFAAPLIAKIDGEKKYVSPGVEERKAIILDVATGALNDNISITECSKFPNNQSKSCKNSGGSGSGQGPGFLIDIPSGWKYVDNPKFPSNSVTSEFAIQQIRSQDPQLANAYVDASFSKFQDEVKNQEFAAILRQHLSGYIDPPDKFIATDFKAALGVARVSLDGSFDDFANKFSEKAKAITGNFLKYEKTQELSLGGQPAIKLNFDLKLSGPNDQIAEMVYLVYLVRGSENSAQASKEKQVSNEKVLGSYYVINMTVRKDLAKKYDEIFQSIAQSFRLSSDN